MTTAKKPAAKKKKTTAGESSSKRAMRGETNRVGSAPNAIPVKKNGRPTLRTDELVAEILARCAVGESMTKIFEDDHMPSINTFFLWLRTDKELERSYYHAKEDQAETLVELMRQVSESDPSYLITPEGQKVDPGWETWRNTRINTYKWIAAKQKPKRFGDTQKLALTNAEGNGDPVITIDVLLSSINTKLLDSAERNTLIHLLTKTLSAVESV